MTNLLRLLASNLACICFLIFAGFCLKRDNVPLAWFAIGIAMLSATTLVTKNDDKK